MLDTFRLLYYIAVILSSFMVPVTLLAIRSYAVMQAQVRLLLVFLLMINFVLLFYLV